MNESHSEMNSSAQQRGRAQDPPPADATVSGVPPLSFLNYLSSLVLQAMICMGEVSNPLENKITKDAKQAKFLIETLLMIRRKTVGNLTQEEVEFLDAAICQAQDKFNQVFPSSTDQPAE